MAMRTVETANVDVSLDLEAVLSVLREHPVRLAVLFGSHATGTVHPTSDIDIAVEFDAKQPSDPGYNETFLGLSADLSETLETDDADLVDIRTVSPELAASIFDHGLLLVGDTEHAAELRRTLVAADPATQSPRERLDAALARIDAHLEGDDTGVPASGDSEDEG